MGMRWLVVVCALLGCSHKKRDAGGAAPPRAPALEVQLATCAEALADLGEDMPAATVGELLAPSCPAGCAAGCDSEAGLRALADWLTTTRGKLGTGHAAVAALDAALPGFSVLLPPATALAGKYRLATSLHATASDAWLLLTVGPTEAWIAESTRLTLRPDGVQLTPSSADAAPGRAVSLEPLAGRAGLDGFLDQRLLGLEPGMATSGTARIDSSAAPLLLVDAALPAQRVVDAAQAVASYRVRLPVRLAVTGPTGLLGEHVLSVRPPVMTIARLELDRGGFRLEPGSALQPLTQLPAALAALPAATVRRTLAIDDVGQASVAELVLALDAAADAGFPDVALGQLDAFGAGLSSSSGTIGLSSLTGYPTGNGARRRRDQPTVTLGTLGVTGTLQRELVRRALRRGTPRLLYCYEKQLLIKGELAGSLKLSFAVDAAGKTSAVEATGFDATVASCVTQVLGVPGLFPAGSGVTQVATTLTFAIN
ncbi:MAG: hypothetical protein IT370_18385 [Deltaproteobacteria bacterium]|nr:hypothetical protein [Deltaproteobacteria bacterium]